jgi:putative salt-induced outer membrane protein YdiY
MKHTLSRLGCISAVLLFTATSGWAQAAATPAAPEKKGWETIAAAGLTVQSGNSESIATTISLDTKRKWEEAEAMLGGNGGYGKSSTTGQDRSRTTDYAKAYGQYNHFMTERLYLGLRIDGEHDGIADLAYRVRIAPLIGYYVIKNDKTTLSFDAGPSYVIEEREASPTVPRDKQGYLALRFGEKFEHKLSDTSKIWQTAEYIPAVEDWPEKDLINFEIGISTKIRGNWDLQVKYQVNYDNGVSYGKECTDTRLIAATTYSF